MTRHYFDHNATTPVSAEVLEVLLPALLEVYGNASSIHYYGQLAKQRLEMARRETASLLHCDPREVVFLSGGTEADNLAIKKMAHRFRDADHAPQRPSPRLPGIRRSAEQRSRHRAAHRRRPLPSRSPERLALAHHDPRFHRHLAARQRIRIFSRIVPRAARPQFVIGAEIAIIVSNFQRSL